MTTSRRRRIRPHNKKKNPSIKRKPAKKSKTVSRQFNTTSLLIGLFLCLDIILILFIIRQCARPKMDRAIHPVPQRMIQLEVLNGCGVNGLASRYTDYLRSKGFDVVKTGDHETFNVDETVVIDRRNNETNTMKVIEAMGLTKRRLLKQVSEAYLLDASVVIGRDFRTLPIWQEME